MSRQLVEAIKQNNITQTELKEITGLTQQAISKIETNHEISPSLRNLIKYLHGIGCELTVRNMQ